ncbi:Rv0361 family membrane protein [Nocardia sp. R16R-3T]
MTEQQGADAEPVIEVDQTDRRSMAPFIAAAVFAAVVLIAIVLGAMLSPAEKNVTESDKITAAVQRYAEARAATDDTPPPGVACPGFDESRTPLADQFGGAAAGKSIKVSEIENAMVDGDRAKATVTIEVDGRKTPATWNLTRSGDRWVVCR